MNRTQLFAIGAVGLVSAVLASVGTLLLVHGLPQAQAQTTPPTPQDKGEKEQDKDVKANNVIARQFILTDEDGKVKAVFATDKDKMPVIGLLDGNEKVRISIAVTGGNAPTLSLSSSDGKNAMIAFAITDDDDAMCTFSDKKGKVQAALGVADNSGKLLLNGTQHDK